MGETIRIDENGFRNKRRSNWREQGIRKRERNKVDWNEGNGEEKIKCVRNDYNEMDLERKDKIRVSRGR